MNMQFYATLLFLGLYIVGAREGLPAAMLPWRIRTWLCLIGVFLGATKNSGVSAGIALLFDCTALIAMIAANDMWTLGAFTVLMLEVYAGKWV